MIDVARRAGAVVRACGVAAWLGPGMGLGLGLAACGDDLPDAPIGGMSSSSSTTGPGSLTIDPSTTSTGVATDEAGTTTTTGSGPTTVGIPDECLLSAHCPDGEVCVAPFDQEAGPEGKGAYECVIECVELMDEDRWCADAAACCDPTAACTDRGYCVHPEETGGSEDSGTTGGSTG
jgi:hypothetical protein